MIQLYWESTSSLINQNYQYISNRQSLKQLGLFVVIATMVFTACKRPDESLGEGLQPNEDRLRAVVTDSIALSVSTERVDSLRTDLFANVLVGNYIDDVLGSVKCRGVLQFAPDASVDTLPANRQVYAVELELAYQPEAYGNNTPMFFQVQRLLERIDLDSAYYSNHLPARDYQNLILPGQETHITRSEYAPILSTGTSEFLRLKLNPAFGQFLLANDSALTDVDSFADYFNGLVISSSTADGRVVSFSTINSKMTVYYRYPGDNRLQLGTYTFKYTSSCEAYSVIEQQYFGGALSGLTPANPIAGLESAYLQGGGGTRIDVELADVLWLREVPNVTINKAELVVPYDAQTKFKPLDSLTMVYEKEPDVFTLTADYARNQGGNFRKAPGYYRFNMTNHIQSLLVGELTNTRVKLVANPRVGGLYNTLGTRRSVLRGPQWSDDQTLNMRLVITYSY
jgi:hypothetical protein